MDPKLAEILAAHPEKAPTQLQQLYPRVFGRISDAWSTEQAADVFSELLVADHENRQGFPPGVLRELLVLFGLHQKYLAEELDPADPWSLEPDMTETESAAFVQSLQARDQSFVPEGLFRAVEHGDTRLAFDFVRAGMEVDTRRSDAWTPLMVAMFNGHEETAMMLLSRGANVRTKGHNGYEPIHWAALNGYERAIRFIVSKGGNVNAETEYGWTPLLQAASRGHVGIARFLLDKGATVDASEREGWTPLHKACANGYVEMVRLLVQRGADTRKRSASGITPLELAMKANNFELLEALSPEPSARPKTM